VLPLRWGGKCDHQKGSTRVESPTGRGVLCICFASSSQLSMRLRTPTGESHVHRTHQETKHGRNPVRKTFGLVMQLVLRGSSLVVKRTHVSSQIQLGIRVDARCVFIFISESRPRGLFQVSAVRMQVVVQVPSQPLPLFSPNSIGTMFSLCVTRYLEL